MAIKKIYKRKFNTATTWTAAVAVRGITPPNKPHTKGGFATKEQAEEFARIKEQELLSRLEGIPKLNYIQFNEFVVKYLELCEMNNTPSHFESKKSVIQHSIAPFFNKKKLINIHPVDIETFISKRRNDGSSQKTILSEYTILKHMFHQAIIWDYLRINPCEKVARPKVSQPLPEFLTTEKIKQVFRFIEENEEYHRCFYLVQVLFYTGCRRGEISSLRWSDIDLEQDIIAIQAHDNWQPKDYESRTIE